MIDKELDRLLPKANEEPRALHRAMRYSVFSGGKRLRPILAIESCRLCGGRITDVIRPACAIEMIHTYSLIHDDLPAMDNDDYRRGRPSCHKRFGEATAILAGDALLTLAFSLLANDKDKEHSNKAIRELSKNIGSRGMVGGQEVDLKNKRSLNKKTLNFIMENKTAALFKASLMLGAIFGNADKRKEAALYRFGKFLGLAFQLMDDYFDNDGYARIIGKDKTRKKALEFIEKAKGQLRPFGKRADRLKALADFVVYRRR